MARGRRIFFRGKQPGKYGLWSRRRVRPRVFQLGKMNDRAQHDAAIHELHARSHEAHERAEKKEGRARGVRKTSRLERCSRQAC